MGLIFARCPALKSSFSFSTLSCSSTEGSPSCAPKPVASIEMLIIAIREIRFIIDLLFFPSFMPYHTQCNDETRASPARGRVAEQRGDQCPQMTVRDRLNT